MTRLEEQLQICREGSSVSEQKARKYEGMVVMTQQNQREVEGKLAQAIESYNRLQNSLHRLETDLEVLAQH